MQIHQNIINKDHINKKLRLVKHHGYCVVCVAYAIPTLSYKSIKTIKTGQSNQHYYISAFIIQNMFHKNLNFI